SNGFEHDFDRPNAWRYRDYVVRAFNEDKPYNRFLAEQIAGDELDSVTDDSMIATGFLRSYAKVGYREKDNPNNRYDYLDDMIGTIGRGVLGLTVNCARCHNHKVDPIAQKDYYRLLAFFHNVNHFKNGGPTDERPIVTGEAKKVYDERLAELEQKRGDLQGQIKSVEKDFRAAYGKD